MDLKLDPNATLAELQLTLFMAAITALVELAKTTDKDHIKLRALTEVARLCSPAVRTPLPRDSASGRGGERATGFAQSLTPSMPSSSLAASASSDPSSPPAHGSPIANDGPQAHAPSPAASSPHAPLPVARAPSSDRSHVLTPSSPSRASCSTPTLKRRQRRLLARLEADARRTESTTAAA